MRIVYMGTPDFAVNPLHALAEVGYEVVGVVTQPDKPKGRGYALTPPPVKELALQEGIPVYQPATLRDGQALEILRYWWMRQPISPRQQKTSSMDVPLTTTFPASQRKRSLQLHLSQMS